MRIVVPVDSRVSDAAGLLFVDLLRNACHVVPVETSSRGARNGFRGGCIVGPYLFLCTSSAVVQLEMNWPSGDQPVVRVLQVIRRPEWNLGDRANADLHYVLHDDVNNQLLIANSYMDCVDFLDMGGRLIDRRYLWDISEEVRQFAFDRVDGAADLCHLNSIFRLYDDIVLTLGNLNGSRRGALLSLSTGKLFARGLSFPHDGVCTREGLWLTEAERQRVVLLSDVQSCDELHPNLESHKYATIDLLERQRETDTRSLGRIWVRGLQVTNRHLIVGCSQFSELSSNGNEYEPSHVAIFERRSHRLLSRMYLRSNGILQRPVLYSILVYEDQLCAEDGDEFGSDLVIERGNYVATGY